MDVQSIILLAQATVEHAPEAAEAVEGVSDAGVIGTLGINAKLFVAQLINFSIVLFVLWKWVFGPVVGALEKRQERVEKSLREAKAIEEKVEQFEADHEGRMQKSRHEAEVVIQKAMEAASQVRAETVEESKKEAERILLNARETIEAEKTNAIAEVRKEVAELTIAATQKVIEVKLDSSKDKDLVESILGKL